MDLFSMRLGLWGTRREWASSGNQILIVFRINKEANRNEDKVYRFRMEYNAGNANI